MKKKAEDDAKSLKLEREKSARQQSAKPSTLCIIKPDILIANKQDELIGKIEEKGYTIVARQQLTFTEKMVDEFYAHRRGAENYLELVMYMTSGPCIVLALSRGSADVVQDWRMDIGCVEMEEMGRERDGGIHCNGKNNHFRFSLEDFFWKRGKVIFSLFKSESESEKSEKITFQKRK